MAEVNKEQQTAVAEEQPPKSKRELFGERMKSKYPDREFADDEALFGQIGEDYDNYDAEIGRYKEREDKMTELFAKDPNSAQFFADMARGDDPWVGMLERLGADGITDIMNNPEKRAEYAAANKKYAERVAKSEELQREYDSNLAQSLGELERIQQERGLSDETIDAAYDMIMRISNDALVGKITPETVDLALKAVTHDAEVENARAEGEIAGRNAKIEEKLRKPKRGDGMPTMSGTNAAASETKKKGFFDDLPRRKF